MSIVHHEGPDYVYEPTGLMAEDWGKTGHRTEVADRIRASRLQRRRWMDNDKGRDSIEYVWGLDDATVLEAAHEGTPAHAEVCRRLGKVNPWWVTSQCAMDAYERGIMSAEEMDVIVDE